MPTKEPVVTRRSASLSLANVRVSLPAPRRVTEGEVVERLRVLIRSVAERRTREPNEPIDFTDEVQVSFLDDRSERTVEASLHSSLPGLCTRDVALVDRRVVEVRSVREVLTVSDERLLEVTSQPSMDALLASLLLELQEERLDTRLLEAQHRVLDVLMERCGASNHDEVLKRVAEEHELEVDLRAFARDTSWSVPGEVAAQVTWRAAVIDFVMRKATVRVGARRAMVSHLAARAR